MRIAARRSTTMTWARFESSLATALAVLDDGEVLVIRRKGTNRRVQFTAEDNASLRIESASNTYLDEGERLTLTDCAALVALGWRPPTIAPGHAPVYGGIESPNFHVDMEHPVPVLSVAWMTVATLRHVHGAVTPADLAYEAFTSSDETLDMPELGLERSSERRRAVAAYAV